MNIAVVTGASSGLGREFIIWCWQLIQAITKHGQTVFNVCSCLY